AGDGIRARNVTGVQTCALPIYYTLTVTNNGPSTHTGGITVTDSLPAGTSFSATGSSADCSASGQLVTCSRSPTLAVGGTAVFIRSEERRVGKEWRSLCVTWQSK